MCFHLKICVIILFSFSMFPLEDFDVFWIFLLLFIISDMVFGKDFPTFLWPNKTQGRQYNPSFYRPRITNSWKLFKPNKPKGLFSFLKVEIFGWFTHIVIKEHSSGLVMSGMALYHAQYKHTKFVWIICLGINKLSVFLPLSTFCSEFCFNFNEGTEIFL